MSPVSMLPLFSAVVLFTARACALAQGSKDLAGVALPPDGPKVQNAGQSAPKPLRKRPVPDTNGAFTPEQAKALRSGKLASVNGRPYDQPSKRVLFVDYAKDTYGVPAVARTTVRALYSEGRDAPSAWGTDFPGFMQRFGANAGQTIVSGNVRYAMELTFHEDLRYIPCHGCHVKAKIENALLAEITARHDSDGHRFFTLTPTIADFSGPIVAHSLWYPGGANPAAGAVSARLAFATRIGSHLFREFVLERRHTDKPGDQ